MGRHMAARLAGSCDLVVHDVDAAAVASACAQGARAAGSLRALADQAETVLCSLPTPQVVHDVILGDAGLCHGAKVRRIVDLSTIGPSMAATIAAALAERGIAFIDSPVSGGTSGAAAGTLTLMAAGDPAAVAAVRPQLERIGSTVLVVGETPGQGQTVKLVNNMLFASNLVAAYEATAMAVKAGVPAERLLEVVNASSGRSYITEKRVDPVLDRDFAVRFATGLLRKDVRLAIQEADAAGAMLFTARAAAQLLEIAQAQGMAGEDYAKLATLFEQWNGIEITREPAGTTQ
jgi:3-hydroxyisobutyrate dehydrogenase